MKNTKNFLVGVILIAIGVIIGLNALEIVEINIFFDGWWTLFIIVPCFCGLFDSNDRTGNLIGLLVGVVLLLCVRGVLTFEYVWKLALPVILVIIGLSMIFKNSIVNKIRKECKNEERNGVCATFSSQNVDYDNEKFEGAELNAIFGGIKLDLKKANIKSDVIIDVSSIFGGVTIFVPNDVKVKVTSTSIFGGVDDKSAKNQAQEAKTIYINANCMFGGVEIK